MYRSVNFDSCIKLCNYCHNQDLEQCHHLLKIPPASDLFAVNSPLLCQAPGNYWSPYVPLVLCLPERGINGIILMYLEADTLRFILVWISGLLLFTAKQCSVIRLCHLSIHWDIWVVSITVFLKWVTHEGGWWGASASCGHLGLRLLPSCCSAAFLLSLSV